ncbi:MULTISPECIES: NAD(P)/FAD-dependent oxidoreductase [unclassified Knoellia]|uniref:NAD(P)/FAD-dependent oxidoreductase n=1 Tax=Knoellia altitudinis TaxID=3404795 RepID=UPI003622DF27
METWTQPLWWENVRRSPAEPPGIPDRADVTIVGAGYTGLWTAYYLLRDRPDLDVLVLEAEHVGFGASGRNGGWVSSLWPVAPARIAATHGRDAAQAMLAELRSTVTHVGQVCREEAIDADFAHGGVVIAARGRAQAHRAMTSVAESEQWGHDTRWLDPAEAHDLLAVDNLHGATWSPHCARVHPMRLVQGLAAAVRRRGGRIVEGVRVLDAQPGAVRVSGGVIVRSGAVVRATEAWTARLPRLRRKVVPVYSLMVATAPLPASVWDEIGLARREVFSDHGHVIIYGQRTEDDRIAFGGRGAPYHWGSAIHPSFDADATVFAALRRTLTSLLPQVGDVEFTHAWGGPLAVARDWQPSVGFDAAAGVGWAGGYVGDGVAASNLAGRTLADLINGRSTALTSLPWVGHVSPRWEPEPLRYLGVNAGLRLASLSDAQEARTGLPSRLTPLLGRLTGG